MTASVEVTASVVAVIVSKDTRDTTLRCVRSVLAQRLAGATLAVVVVDNASSDGTVEALRTAHDGQITVVANARNVGFGAACNAGAALAPSARWFLFLNADVDLQEGAVAALLDAGDARPKAAVLGPRFAFPGGRSQPAIRGDPTRAALLYQHTVLRFLRIGRVAYRAYRDPLAAAVPLAPCAAQVILGAAMLIRGDRFRALSGFDERYFLYFEEADLQRRAREAGDQVFHIPAALAIHVGGASSDPVRAKALLWYLRSLFLYVDRFDGRLTGLCYRAIFKPLFVLKMLTDLVRDVLTLFFRARATKRAEIGLAFRFFTVGLWSFLTA